MLSIKNLCIFVVVHSIVQCFFVLQVSLNTSILVVATAQPNVASGRGGGMSNPNFALAAEPGDSHWFDEPPVIGADPILSSSNEIVNADTSFSTKNVGGRHGKFWEYWQKKQGDTTYGLRGPVGKRSQYVPYLTLRDSFGLGKVLSNRKDHFPVNQVDDDLPDTKPPAKVVKKADGAVEKK